MTVIVTRLTVAPDGAISTATPLTAGEYEASIATAPTSPPWPGKPFTVENFPMHDEPWDDGISPRREDMYDENGRLR